MNRRVFFLLFLICLAAALPALGGKENDGVIQVTGRVRLVGSGPMTELVITGPDKEWYIEKKDGQKLKDHQQRTVTVEGVETVTELTFANGRSAGTRRTLSKIKIIKIE